MKRMMVRYKFKADRAAALVRRCAEMAKLMIEEKLGEHALVPGGRKGHQLDTRAQLLGSTSQSDI